MSIYCHNCGEELSRTASFCLKCGALRSTIERSMEHSENGSAESSEPTKDEKAFIATTSKNLTIERTLSIIFGIAGTCLGGLMLFLSLLMLCFSYSYSEILVMTMYTYLIESIILFVTGIFNLVNIFSVNKVRSCCLNNDLKPAQKRYDSSARTVLMFLFCTDAWILHIINKCRFNACRSMVSDIIVKQRDGKFDSQGN